MNISSKDVSEIYSRDNIGILAVLSYTAYPEVCFVVANTHILFNRNRGDIKLAQVYQLTNTMNILKNHFSQKFSKVNLMICADLNSAPNSGVYKMITTGKVNCSKLDRRKVKIPFNI